jgi:hypothetical protein
MLTRYVFSTGVKAPLCAVGSDLSFILIPLFFPFHLFLFYVHFLASFLPYSVPIICICLSFHHCSSSFFLFFIVFVPLPPFQLSHIPPTSASSVLNFPSYSIPPFSSHITLSRISYLNILHLFLK